MDEFEQGPLVAILIGSESDRERMQGAIDELDSRGISNELRVLSAHRNPREVADYAATARDARHPHHHRRARVCPRRCPARSRPTRTCR